MKVVLNEDNTFKYQFLQTGRTRQRHMRLETMQSLLYSVNSHVARLGRVNMPKRFTALPDGDDGEEVLQWFDDNVDALGQSLVYDLKPVDEWPTIIVATEATRRTTQGNFLKFLDVYFSLVNVTREVVGIKYLNVDKPQFLNM